MLIPTELRTAHITRTPAHGLGEGDGVVRWDPSNILQIDGRYHVWYSHVRAGLHRDEVHAPNVLEIWMATSEDGHHWTEHGNVIAPSPNGAWHERGKHAPHMVPGDDGRYYLFFSAQTDLHGRNVFLIPPEKHIGLAVSDRPEGPFEYICEDPILSPSREPERFDHILMDDPCIIRRDGKYWLYYKGRSSDTSQCWLGVATSEEVAGPFVKPQKEPVCDADWHTGCVWPHREGVAGVVDRNCLAYSKDGLDFQLGAEVGHLLDASVYCPDAFDDDGVGKGISWGLAQQGDPVYLYRWEAAVRAS